jgi:hypothetical protein
MLFEFWLLSYIHLIDEYNYYKNSITDNKEM